MDRGKATVSHVERMHATNKSSFSSSGSDRRNAEGAIYYSTCKKLMAGHVARGRVNYAAARSSADYAKKKYGLRTASSARRRFVKKPGGGVRRTTWADGEGPGAKIYRNPDGNLAWTYVSVKSRLAKIARGCRSWG
eukprot:1966163-Pyramimonas_sp.AAC.1